MKAFLWALRIIVGGLFIFSGLVKANDPLGLSYKMDEFFEVWGLHNFSKFSLALSVTMIAFEIIAGFALLIGYAQRVFSVLLLGLITFFTFLTAYVLFSGKIKECGCFGDCIKISNWETFWKDVALLVMAIILFLFRKRIPGLLRPYPATAVMVLVAFFSFGIQWWALEHLPFVDCLPYKKGANLWAGTQPPAGCIQDSVETVLVYEKGGVKKEFGINNIPWQDSTWVYDTTVSKVVREGNCDIAIKDFSLKDFSADAADHTEEILTTKGPVYLFFVRNPAKARSDNMPRLVKLAREAQAAGIPFYVLLSTDAAGAEAFRQKHKLEGIDFLSLDGTASKTAMRSNPGLMVLKDGVVQAKYSFRDYPASAN